MSLPMRSLSFALIAALSAAAVSSHGSLAACSASLMIASTTGCSERWREHDGAEHVLLG